MELRSGAFIPIDSIPLAPSEQPKSKETAPIDDCGVCAVWTRNGNAPELTVQIMYELMNRGRASSGIGYKKHSGNLAFQNILAPHLNGNGNGNGYHLDATASFSDQVQVDKGLGPADEVLNIEDYRNIYSEAAVGHDRYTTDSETTVENAQPFHISDGERNLVFGHNGNLNNKEELLSMCKSLPPGDSDSAHLAQALIDAPGDTWQEKIQYVLPRVNGSFSFTGMTDEGIIAARDFRGNRPLWLGYAEDGNTVIFSSESGSLERRGMMFEPVNPGEVIQVNKQGEVVRYNYMPGVEYELDENLARCVKEVIYLMDRESRVDFGDREQVWQIRQRLGKILAQNDPLFQSDNPECIIDPETRKVKHNTLVTGIPMGGLDFAEGYSQEVEKYGVKYDELFERPPHSARSYQGQEEQRAQIAHDKLIPKRQVLEFYKGQKLELIVEDDSVIRGTVTLAANTKIRELAQELNIDLTIHTRSGSSIVKHECNHGMVIELMKLLYTKNKGELKAMAQAVGADSIYYQSVDNLIRGIVGEKYEEKVDDMIEKFGVYATAWRVLGHCINCIMPNQDHDGKRPIEEYGESIYRSTKQDYQNGALTPIPLLQGA